MNLTIILAAGVAAAFTGLGTAKVAKTASMRARAEHVGFSMQAYQLIGAAEMAGALGVLGGLWFTPLGYAAGACLLLLMAGALVTHIRVGDQPAAMLPAAAFTVATASYLVSLGS